MQILLSNSQAEQLSKRRKKFLATAYKPLFRALYLLSNLSMNYGFRTKLYRCWYAGRIRYFLSDVVMMRKCRLSSAVLQLPWLWMDSPYKTTQMLSHLWNLVILAYSCPCRSGRSSWPLSWRCCRGHLLPPRGFLKEWVLEVRYIISISTLVSQNSQFLVWKSSNIQKEHIPMEATHRPTVTT